MPRRSRKSGSSSSIGGAAFVLVCIAGLLASFLPSRAPTPTVANQATATVSAGAATQASALTEVPPTAAYAALSSPKDVAAELADTKSEPRSALESRPSRTTVVARDFDDRRWQIRGRKVPLRSAAEPGSPLVDRLDTGRVVTVLELRQDYARVRVETTQREGWIPIKRIGDEAPEGTDEAKPRIAPVLSVAMIAKLLIAASIADYPGPCACPYQSTRNGSSCGRRAAYSRPGGYAPLCYERDVTSAMVQEYRRSH